MKKNIFLAIAIATAFVSCNSNEDLASGSFAVSSSSSASISNYLSQNYPETKIISTVSSGSNLTATLNTGEMLTFTSNGNLISYSNNFKAGMKADSIPTPPNANPNDSVAGHHRGGDGHGKPGGGYGNGHGKPGKHGHDKHFENEIPVDSLSATITSYISANYSGFSIIHAESDTICQGTVTEVLVCTAASEPQKLIFDTAGNFLFKGERIKYANVPAAVSDAVTANYSAYYIMKRAGKLTLTDGSNQYRIFMELDKVRKSVTFNADGTVACEK